MRMVVRLILKIVVLWIVACIERSIGIPVLLLILGVEWAVPFDQVARSVWLVYVAILIMSLFELAPVVALIVMYGLWVWFIAGNALLKSKTARLLVGIVGGSLVASWLMPGQLSVGNTVYLGLVAAGFTILTKRKRLIHTYKRIV